MSDLSLPLAAALIPEALTRFLHPSAPTAAKMMAAKGMVPVSGADLVLVLVQLSYDADAKVAETASASLAALPEAVVVPGAQAPIHAAVLHALAHVFARADAVLASLVENSNTDDETLAHIALRCSEPLSEIIATNQQRLLRAPRVIEALYKNRNTRMSTADRLIELAARNGVELTGIPSFHEHVKAIQGQLIPEPSSEPDYADVIFNEALAADSDEDAVNAVGEDGDEELKEQFVPLAQKIRDMSIGEKIRFALLGNAAARSILIRDPNRIVAMAAISSPTMGESEAKAAAKSREISDDVLRYISKKREWTRTYDIKHALAFNPKTPLGISMEMLTHLRRNDIRTLARSRGIPDPLKRAAIRRAQNYGE